MTTNAHCPVIHGGLQISLKNQKTGAFIKHCCSRYDLHLIMPGQDVWNNSKLTPLRELNKTDVWDPGCWSCQGNERAGLTSFRTGMLEKFGKKENLSGPQRLDLMFDISCNLACRSCGPDLSTFWQKHLKENDIPFRAPSPESRINEMIGILKTLDLTNLEMVVFCGGETLLGNGYWQVAEEIIKMVPDAKEKLTLCFQTNGTQTVNPCNYSIIEKVHLIKLHISLDGTGERFEYLRWPASWEQVTDNLKSMRDSLPVNVMFLIEETMSIFNLYYQCELEQWVKDNFSTNRLGDTIDHSRHIATGIFSLSALTTEYANALKCTTTHNLINTNWKENSYAIKNMIQEINKFDKIRNQNWKTTFPEVAEFYYRYL